jgi:hypothetical protein
MQLCEYSKQQGVPMLAVLDNTPLTLFIILALTLGLAPFVPEPHLFEKTRMLFQGQLVKPIDIFDFFLHFAPWALLALKLWRSYGTAAS